MDATSVIAIATSVYGLATFALWWENRQDRIQRNRQHREDMADRRLRDLHSAFYDAWGYWAAEKLVDHKFEHIPQTAKMFEAFMRLEGELRLNGHTAEADRLGYAARTKARVDEALVEVGTLLGLAVEKY